MGWFIRRPARSQVRVRVGLIGAAAAGLLYLASLAFTEDPVISVAVLLVGRAVLGAAESFIITGGVSWGMGLVDPTHAGSLADDARSPGGLYPTFPRTRSRTGAKRQGVFLRQSCKAGLLAPEPR